jgi:hypothetical protein
VPCATMLPRYSGRADEAKLAPPPSPLPQAGHAAPAAAGPFAPGALARRCAGGGHRSRRRGHGDLRRGGVNSSELNRRGVASLVVSVDFSDGSHHGGNGGRGGWVWGAALVSRLAGGWRRGHSCCGVQFASGRGLAFGTLCGDQLWEFCLVRVLVVMCLAVVVVMPTMQGGRNLADSSLAA